MKIVSRLRSWLRAMVHRGRMERQLDQELHFHIQRVTEDLMKTGVPISEARHRAGVAFGSVNLHKDECRDVLGLRWVDELSGDVRYALRQLRRSPTFTAIAVLSLALAIGATTAVYNTADWLLNRSPEGVTEPDRLMTVQLTERERPEVSNFGFSLQQYDALRPVQNAFSDLAAYGKLAGVISNDVRADQIVFELVTGNYFQVLGLRPELGRLVTPDDDLAGVPPVAVVSHNLWQSQFGGDPGIVGKSIRLNGVFSRVVGVLPREFLGYRMDWNGPSSVWVPMKSAAALGFRNITVTPQSFFRIIGRMRGDTTFAVATQRAQAWLPQLPRLRTEMMSWTPNAIVITRSEEMRIGKPERESARRFLGVLLTVCALILLAACFNIANFLMGRTIGRRRELGLRVALGASRSRLVRQLLTEATLLGSGASAVGIVVGVGIAKLLSRLPYVYLNLPSRTTPLTTPAADVSMLGVGLALGIISALIFGLLPALSGSFRNPVVDLGHPAPQWTWHGVRLTARQTLLVLQVALSAMLAVIAGLYGRSFARVMSVGSDYAQPQSVLIARVVPTGLSAEGGSAFYQALLSRLNALPEVVSASIGLNPPYTGGAGTFSVPGKEDSPVRAGLTTAAPKLFETLGVPILYGREIASSEDDLRNALVVNRVLAERLWPHRNPVGESVLYLSTRKKVIGVVADDHCNDLLGEASPCAWQAFTMGTSSGYLRIRTKGTPTAFVPALRALVHELHPDVAVAEASGLDGFIGDLTGTQRMAAMASSALAVFGVVLLSIGCLSLFQSMVKDSLREIAIRMALGATPGRLTRRILAQGLVLTMAGIAIGLGAARVLASRMADQLYRTDINDALTFVTIPLLLTCVSIATVGYAAWLATQTEPARHLQSE